jgi:hypothetical protein
MPEGSHPLPAVELDGRNWPLDVAASLLSVPERDLRDLIRILGLEPEGRANMRSYRAQGRTSRVYSARHLILIAEGIISLRESLQSYAP